MNQHLDISPKNLQHLLGLVEGAHVVPFQQEVSRPFHVRDFLPGKYILMNPRDYAIIRMFSRDDIDLENRLPFLQQGVMCYLDGGASVIVVNKAVPKNSIYFITDDQVTKMKVIDDLND